MAIHHAAYLNQTTDRKQFFGSRNKHFEPALQTGHGFFALCSKKKISGKTDNHALGWGKEQIKAVLDQALLEHKEKLVIECVVLLSKR